MKNWKSIVVLLLVFLAGLVVGVVGTRTAVRHYVQRAIMQPERVQLFVERDLSWKLSLDRAQRIKLHEILSDSRMQLREIRQQIQPQTALIFSNANTQITAMLTPEQQATYERFKSSNFLFSRSQRTSPPSHVLP
ncbi:MAG TPA: hypothetical protein VG347_02910 [Verrucomicrobiae bacterium]|nr:hypothetical protein [Verrucomicrobiae bacterium]